MGKHKRNRPFNDEDAKMYGGQVTDYFARVAKKKKRGRPKKNKNQGRPKKASPPTHPPHMRKSPPEIAVAAAAAAGKRAQHKMAERKLELLLGIAVLSIVKKIYSD